MNEYDRKRFMLVAKSRRFARRVAEAQEAIRQAIKQCKNPAVSFSFGKDSLVCLDIARRIKPDILVINIDRGEGGDLDEAVQMYEEFARENNLNYHRVKTPKEIFEIYQEAGSIHNLTHKNLRKNLEVGIKIANEMFNIDCPIIGLRAEESAERMHLLKYGTFHYDKTEKIYKCKPVLHWKGDEIWAYIVSHGLPYLPWYDKEARFCGYEKARYSNWAGLAQKTYGRFIHLKVNYPEEFNRLAKMFPEVKKYT